MESMFVGKKRRRLVQVFFPHCDRSALIRHTSLLAVSPRPAVSTTSAKPVESKTFLTWNLVRDIYDLDFPLCERISYFPGYL